MLDTKRRVTNLFAAGLLMIAAIFGLLGETTTSTGLFHDSTQTILAAPAAPTAPERPAPAAAGRAPIKSDFKCSNANCGAFHGGVYSVHYCANCYIKIMNGGKS